MMSCGLYIPHKNPVNTPLDQIENVIKLANLSLNSHLYSSVCQKCIPVHFKIKQKVAKDYCTVVSI